MLLPYKVNDFTQLLCASGKAGHFQHNDGIARLGFLFLRFRGYFDEEKEDVLPKGRN